MKTILLILTLFGTQAHANSLEFDTLMKAYAESKEVPTLDEIKNMESQTVCIEFFPNDSDGKKNILAYRYDKAFFATKPYRFSPADTAVFLNRFTATDFIIEVPENDRHIYRDYGSQLKFSMRKHPSGSFPYKMEDLFKVRWAGYCYPKPQKIGRKQ